MLQGRFSSELNIEKDTKNKKTKQGKQCVCVCGGGYLSTRPQVVDDSLDSVDHLQSHLLFLWPWGDVVVEVVDLLVQPA